MGKSYNLFLDADLDRNLYLSDLQLLTLICELPLEELRKECAAWNCKLPTLTGDDDHKCSQLKDLLFFGMVGVPLHRLDSHEAISRVGSQYVEIAQLDMKQLKERCSETNIPIGDDLKKEDYVTQLQYASLGWELPWPELEQECVEFGIPLKKFRFPPNEQEKRGLVLMLLFAKWADIPIHRFDTRRPLPVSRI